MDDTSNPQEVQAMVDRIWDCPLDMEGIQMAIDFAKKLERPQIVISSPMLRCFQTAGAALSVWGGLIQVDARWCEVWHPKVLKAPLAEAKLRTFAEYQEHYRLFARMPYSVPKEEETRGLGGSADARYIDAMKKTAKELKDDGITSAVVVSHGDMLQSVASVIGGMSIYGVEYLGSITTDYNWATGKFTLVSTDGIQYFTE